MKGTLKLEDGREFTVELGGKALDHPEEPKKTGYEKVAFDEKYWFFDGYDVDINYCNGDRDDQLLYENANYYSDKTVAENNARADTLRRKLRRFAVEHRKKESDWKCWSDKFYIEYNYEDESLETDSDCLYRGFGKIYFDSNENAEAAIEEFKDELIWYFTEYKDSL